MLLHYLEKVNSSNLLQITTEKIKKCVEFDKNETFMLSYGWLEIGVIVFYSICSKSPPLACTHARRRLRHSSIALSMMLWSTSCHTCCKRCFSSSVSCNRDWYSVGRRSRSCDQPDYGQDCLLAKDPVERRRCSRSRTVSRASVLRRCPVEKRKIPDTSNITGSSCFDRSTSWQ